MNTISLAEKQALEKAYQINSDIDILLGEIKTYNEIEEKSWNSLLAENGIASKSKKYTLSIVDHIVYSIAGITGGLLDLTKQYNKAMTNDNVAKYFDSKCKEYVNKINGNEGGMPAIDSKVGGPDHRIWGPTHDLARIFETIKGIMRGEFKYKINARDFEKILTAYKLNKDEIINYIKIEDPIDALIVLLLHLLSDFFTKKSLPIPGRTKLIENGSEEVIREVLKEYRNGGNLRKLVSDFINTLSSALLISLLCRFYRYFDLYSESGSIKSLVNNLQLKDDFKYHILLRNASTICFVISVGKAAFTNNLLAVNYVNFVQICKSGMSINRLLKAEQQELFNHFENKVLAIERI